MIHLKVTLVRTTQVKDFKVHVLVFEYEILKMEEEVFINDLIQQITTITNRFMFFGRSFGNVDLVYKFLKSIT